MDAAIKAIALTFVIVLVCGYGFLVLRSTLYHRRVRADRSGVTIDTFAAEFADCAFPREILQLAFQDFVLRYGSPVHRDDKLFETLALDDDDLEDMLEPRLAARGLNWQDLSSSPLEAILPLVTVEDYVRFLSELTRHAQTPGAS